MGREKIGGWLKKQGKPLVSFRGTPHELALAFGLGIALGVIPGTGAIAAAAVATILRLNLPLMLAGAFLTNPVTTPLVYGASYVLGHWLLGDLVSAGTIARVLLKTILGNLVLAIVLGAIGYAVIFGLVSFYHSQRDTRQRAPSAIRK